MKIGKYTFEYICDIVPRLEDGKLFKGGLKNSNTFSIM
jgi:hypothetical protein